MKNFKTSGPLKWTLIKGAIHRVEADEWWIDTGIDGHAFALTSYGPGLPSRFTGDGHFTLVTEGVKFDVDMQAVPLSYTTMSRSYPSLPLRGSAVGRIKAAGMAERFDVQTTLAGEGGGEGSPLLEILFKELFFFIYWF